MYAQQCQPGHRDGISRCKKVCRSADNPHHKQMLVHATTAFEEGRVSSKTNIPCRCVYNVTVGLDTIG